jgi:hypothetical protein
LPTADGSVIDTVVLRYFLLVGRMDLLLALLPAPRLLPSAVFDPEDEAGARGSLSEISESVRYHEALSRDARLEPEERGTAAETAARLGVVREHLDALEPTTVAPGVEEDTFSDLVSKPVAGMVLPLGPGEAACIAIGIERNVTVVTDDADALRVLNALSKGHPYERIRKLLVRAAEEHLCSRSEANAVHRAMTEQGFWDTSLPFPVKKVVKRTAKKVAKRRPPSRAR